MKLNIFLAVASIFLFEKFSFGTNTIPHVDFNAGAKFIWADSTGNEHQTIVYFLRSFEMKELPSLVNLHLFADSHYHLIVNGNMINTGPARFLSLHPEYDSYNIAPFLHRGNNFILVKVLGTNKNTFGTFKNVGGFIAWGEFKEKDGHLLDFSTPGDWKSFRTGAYDSKAPRFSFDNSPIDVYDARLDTALEGFNLASKVGWKAPVVLSNQNVWAKLTPRFISSLTEAEVLPKISIAQYPILKDEKVISFSIKTSDQKPIEHEHSYPILAYTYLFSPSDQLVPVGLWKGDYYLNGVKIEKDPVQFYRPNRIDYTLNLKKGWNFFFVKYMASWSGWDFYMALPDNMGIKLAADKIHGSSISFRTTSPFPFEQEKFINGMEMPLKSTEINTPFAIHWVDRMQSEKSNNPYFDMAWTSLGDAVIINKARVSDITIDANEGKAIVFDMAGEKLGRIFVDIDAPEGTKVDIGWSEDLKANRINFYKFPDISAGACFTCKKGLNHFETFKNFGVRYLELHISNNKSQARLINTGVIQQTYPYSDVASFECSDPQLNEVWNLGRHTMKAVSEDVFTDSFLDRGLSEADMLVESIVYYMLTGDTKLVKHCLILSNEKFRNNLNPIVQSDTNELKLEQDLPLINLLNLAWYVRLTGDSSTLRSLYPAYKQLMEGVLLLKQTDGAYKTKNIFVDRISMERKNSQLLFFNVLVKECFSQMACMAGKLDLVKDQKEYYSLAMECSDMINRQFYNSKEKSFFDGYNDKGLKISVCSPISASMPILFNISNSSQLEESRRYFQKNLIDIGGKVGASENYSTSPYGGFYILGALYKSGNVDLAERFIRQYWFKMSADNENTAWEMFSKDLGTLCHGWSTSPTYYLSTCLLGVKLGFPDTDDLSKVVIAPQAESVNWARGVVAHPTGAVRVDWRVEGKKLFVNYSVKPDIKVEVKPQGRLSHLELFVNGVRI
jgi:alpha-L-rhamnosidase